jgi:putative OPT family oligopeptide transporter
MVENASSKASQQRGSSDGDDAEAAPYVSAGRDLPQITAKAVMLGVLLSVVLGAANVYLGLKAGMTVAASIPAAVISMGLLRAFKRSNVLENNIVQTAASAGESLAAGVIFTIPALVMLGAWQHFHYWQTTLLAAMGGVIGVLFTVPLRRALIMQRGLRFPEGVATAEVLKLGDQGGRGVKVLAAGGLIGAVVKFGASGLMLWRGVVEGAFRFGGSIGYIGLNAAPALIAVGYIVGINIAVLVFVGGALNWFVAIPMLAGLTEWPAYQAPGTAAADWATFVAPPNNPALVGEPVSAREWAWRLWSERTRYIGVGAMVVGGLWALIRMVRPIVAGVGSGLAAHRQRRMHGASHLPRTERDAPTPWVGVALGLSLVPLFLLYWYVTDSATIASVMAVVMLGAGFVFSGVAAYMAGLVGSSNNPVSGVTIATILGASLLLLAMGMATDAGPTAAILVGAVVCCAAAIGGDNMQDLKAGALVGATPWKQQVMQMLGVLAAALVMAPVLTLLVKAYGIGPITVPGQEALPAPQAALMASVAGGVFEQNLPWAIVAVGMGLAVVVIALDLVLEKRGMAFRAPVLAVAVGLYLPLELGTTILLGGLIAYAADRAYRRDERKQQSTMTRAVSETVRNVGQRTGLLFAAGLITGEALLGILLAIPLILTEGANPMAVLNSPVIWPGLIAIAGVGALLYRLATRKPKQG